MGKIRLQRVAQQMKQIVSNVITLELKDPRCGFITIVSVKVAPDLKTARVNYSVFGSDAQKRSVRRALESARGYVQARVAQETKLKYTPVITFHFDESVERDIDFSKRIAELVEADRRTAAARAIRAKIAAGSIPDDVVNAVSREAASGQFVEHVAALLLRLMSVNTAARAELEEVAAAELECLQIIEADFRQAWGDDVRAEYLAIDPDIGEDEAYRPPEYTAAPGRPPLAAEEAYKDRANLMIVLTRGDLGEPERPEAAELLKPMRLLFNTHIDTRPPHRHPSREGGGVAGAGAADAKGQAAMILAAGRLLKHLRDQLGVRVCEDLCAQFVIDKESGGNGSLCIGLQDPFACDGIVVCTPTGLTLSAPGRQPDSALAVYAAESLRRVIPDGPAGARPCEPEGDAAVLAGLFPGRDIVAFGPGEPSADRISLHQIAAGAKILVFLVLESAGFMT
ncbi:MAG: 30S ribosome-binding factor RbfA [Planctomycetota bacterium]